MTIKVENRRIATVKLTDAESFSRVAKVNADSALNSAQLAEQSKIDAEIAQNSAQSSANNANIDANQAEQDRIQTGIDRAATEGFRDSAEAAKNAAEGFRNQAEGFRDQAEGLRNQAEIARDVTEGFRDNAEAARDAAEGFRDQAEGFRNQAEIARDAAEGFRDTAESHKDDAETAAQAAEAARDDAQAAVADLTPFQDAVTKAHDQNTDTALDEGGPNEVTAATLAELASAERREQFFQTVLQPVGVNTSPDVLYWPTPYRAIEMDATAVRAGSDATFFDRFGVLQNADPDTFRRDFDPATGAFKGALAEPQRTNLLLRSAELSVSPWAFAVATCTPLLTVSPRGGFYQRVQSTSTTNAAARISQTFASTTGVALSFYAQPGNPSDLISFSVNPFNIGFNTTTMTRVTGSPYSDEGTLTVTKQGVHYFVEYVLPSGDVSSVFLYPNRSGAGTEFFCDFADVQLEQAAFPSSYIKTEATTVTRPADTLTIPQVGDRRRGFICWQGVMRFDNTVDFSNNIRRYPFGVGASGVAQTVLLRSPARLTGAHPSISGGGLADIPTAPGGSFQNRLVRAAYWWDVDNQLFGISVDGVSAVNDTLSNIGAGLAGDVRFGQSADTAKQGSSHTDWIYISYNVPPIAQIEALTGAVL